MAMATAGSRARLGLALGLLSAIGPLSIDLYLPALPSMATELQAAPADLQRTLSIFFLALAAAQTRKIRERLTLARTVPEDVNQGPIVGAMLAGWAVVKGERAGGRVPPPPSRSSSAASSSPRTRPNPRGRRSGPTSDLTTSSF